MRNFISFVFTAVRGYVWSGFWLNLAGFPKKEIDNLCKIVLDDKANDVFKTMKIKVRLI